VTGVIHGITLPVLSDGSRLFWALPSPVHEELGYGPSCPTGYKVMRWFPHLLFTARSRITSCRLCRDHSSRPRKPRAVLAAVKAWPGNLLVCGNVTATASLDGGCARRFGRFEVGTKKRLGRTKKLTKGSVARGPPRVPCLTAGSLPLDSGPHTRMTAARRCRTSKSRLILDPRLLTLTSKYNIRHPTSVLRLTAPFAR
jgi:hypothetical protein